LDELHVYDAATLEHSLLVRQDSISWVQWSPSDKAVAFIQKDGSLSVLHVEKGLLKKVCDAPGSYDWLDDDTLVVAHWRGDETTLAANRDWMLSLYNLPKGTSKELFPGSLPQCLANDRIVYNLGWHWYVGSLDGRVKREIPAGSDGSPQLLTISPCKRYLLVRRRIRTRGWHGTRRESLVLDTDLAVCGATLKTARGVCDWIIRKSESDIDD